MTVSFITLGCKVNQYESVALSELFAKKGFTPINDEKADITVVNSCTVTAESNRKTRQTVRKVRRSNPDAVIVLTGCMAQAFFDEAKEILEADIVVGNTDYENLPDLCLEFLKAKKRICIHKEHTSGEKICALTVSSFPERTRAYIKIEDGCDRFCSYCIIPFAKGRVRSKSLELIKSEAEALGKAGYKEVVLTGINLSAFGKDTGDELCDAVEVVCECEGIERVRLGSLECDQISDEALKKLASLEKFCPQFHLSLQSGSDNTLKAMNRKYDTAFYRDFVGRIRKFFDNPSITTDIMVGFAGETDEDFRSSAAFVEEIGFARSHVFVYSIRKGTVAAKRTDQVDPYIKQKRAKIMGDICAGLEQEFLKSQAGLVCKVLFETGENGYFEGYTENYTRVKVKTDDNLEGQILPVKLLKAENDYCIAELI